MKRFALIFAALAAAFPAAAQNAGQIAKARAGSSCPHCNLFQADFSGAELRGKSYAGARLRQADLSTASMSRTSFAGADLRDAALPARERLPLAELTPRCTIRIVDSQMGLCHAESPGLGKLDRPRGPCRDVPGPWGSRSAGRS